MLWPDPYSWRCVQSPTSPLNLATSRARQEKECKSGRKSFWKWNKTLLAINYGSRNRDFECKWPAMTLVSVCTVGSIRYAWTRTVIALVPSSSVDGHFDGGIRGSFVLMLLSVPQISLQHYSRYPVWPAHVEQYFGLQAYVQRYAGRYECLDRWAHNVFSKTSAKLQQKFSTFVAEKVGMAKSGRRWTVVPLTIV